MPRDRSQNSLFNMVEYYCGVKIVVVLFVVIVAAVVASPKQKAYKYSFINIKHIKK